MFPGLSLGNEPDCISHDANVSASAFPISVIACNSVTSGRLLFLTAMVPSSRCFSCTSDSCTGKMAVQQEFGCESKFAKKVTIVQSFQKTDR